MRDGGDHPRMPQGDSFAPTLLIAMPQLQDKNFTRSVILLCEHSGNGAIGLETTPLGTAPGHCFLAGVYDETPGDVPRIASAPAWNEVDVYNGSQWLNAALKCWETNFSG